MSEDSKTDNLLKRLLHAWLNADDLAALMVEVYDHVEDPSLANMINALANMTDTLANKLDELIEELENATIQQESD